MKITAVEAIPFRLPLRRDFRWASLKVDLGGFVLVRLRTDEGLTGFGEATPLPDWGGDHGRPGGETQRTVVAIVEQVLGPSILGLDPTEIERAHAAMDRAVRGHSYARTAVDIALHDLWGKALGQPLYRLLGGKFRDSVPVAHMVGLMPFDDAVGEAEGAIADGLTALQIKGGVDADRDVALIAELRRRLGDDVFLRLDANQGYGRAKRGAEVVRRLAEAGASMVEQPVLDREEMALVARDSPIPIMADESAWSPRDSIEVTQKRAADAVSIYLAKAGGIAPARRVAAVLQTMGLPADVNGSIESGIGTAANLHFALAAAPVELPCVIPINAPAGTHPYKVGGNYYGDDVIAEPLPAANGALLPTKGPGLGIEIDEARLERFREH